MTIIGKGGVEMKANKISFFCILCMLIYYSNLLTQDLSGRFSFGFFGSSIKMVGGEIDRSTIDQWAGFQFKYGYSTQLVFGVNFAYGWVYPRDPNGSPFKAVGKYKTELVPFDLNFAYYFPPQSTVRPFISVGTGLLVWDIRELENNISIFSRGKSLKGGQLNATLRGGLGLELFLTSDYTLNMLLNYHRLLKGDEDTIGFGDDGNQGIIELRFGISFYFSAFKDRDRDGIEDKYDLDPLRAEDLDGFQDNDGAPDPDNDQDGIPDSRDKAPNRPEDIDGYMDDDGIPDLDNDGDKIKDVNDKCPNTPEDFDEFEDHDGCPDLDNDKDGIPDSLDQCPNLAEDFNGYSDEDGCPDKKPEPEPEPFEIGREFIIKGLTFASGSARLNPASFHILDEIVKSLADYPNIELEIRGYTDNTGDFASNQRLSERRAYAVRKYLIDYGINLKRIRAVGYGELGPIASNLTREGRAANRRIEFVRIK